MNVAAFIESRRSMIDALLLEAGAVLFRGFGVRGANDFRQFAQAISKNLLEYEYRSTPRSDVVAGIYTATEYPAAEVIPLHCENAYQRDWPMKIMFQCAVPPRQAGETPLADVERVTARIGDDILRAFAERRVAYMRTCGNGIDLSWQTVFQTTSKAEVEAFCRSREIEWEWLGEDRIRTRQVCQGVAQHPLRKTWVYFNQAHLFHVSSLGQSMRAAMLGIFDERSLPRNAYFGNGDEIPVETLERVRAAFEAEKVVFPWNVGDAMVVDNMRVAHGRNAFSGPRKILVAMSEAYSQLTRMSGAGL
jgi:hypothetical protein